MSISRYPLFHQLVSSTTIKSPNFRPSVANSRPLVEKRNCFESTTILQINTSLAMASPHSIPVVPQLKRRATVGPEKPATLVTNQESKTTTRFTGRATSIHHPLDGPLHQSPIFDLEGFRVFDELMREMKEETSDSDLLAWKTAKKGTNMEPGMLNIYLEWLDNLASDLRMNDLEKKKEFSHDLHRELMSNAGYVHFEHIDLS